MRPYRFPGYTILFAVLFSGAMFSTLEAAAQTARLGVGLNSMLSTADGFGVGFRGRASAPVNRDLSVALDLGFTGFVFGGRRDAEYIFDPQFSAIVSLPSHEDRLNYVLFGLGGYIPLGGTIENRQNGPTVHLGMGWVRALYETSLFYEVNPALIIGERSVDLAIPFRIGVIF